MSCPATMSVIPSTWAICSVVLYHTLPERVIHGSRDRSVLVFFRPLPIIPLRILGRLTTLRPLPAHKSGRSPDGRPEVADDG